jgi:hypothetical protein
MASGYPGAIDNFTDATPRAGNLADALVKIETELGTNPSLDQTDVAALLTILRDLPVVVASAAAISGVPNEVLLSAVIGRGDNASRPAPSTAMAGRLWYSTTDSQLQRDSGSAWEAVEGAGGGGGGTSAFSFFMGG